MLICELDDFEVLKACKNPPCHLAFVGFVTALFENVIYVDFDTGR